MSEKPHDIEQDIEDLVAQGEQKAHRLDDELDLTPMVDVTFLLLIFFMITAAFALQKAIEVPPVEDEQAAAQTIDDLEQDSIVVRVDADNIFWVSSPAFDEQRAPSKPEMRSKVREARDGPGGSGGSGGGPTKLLVQAHGDSLHEYVVAALDAGSAVQVNEIRLMSYEDGDLGF